MLRKIVSLKDERMVAVGIHRVLCFQFEQVLNVIRYIYITFHSSPKKTPIKGSSCPSDSVACINNGTYSSTYQYRVGHAGDVAV